MTDQLAIALAQLNPTVGALEGNAALLRDARMEAAALGADLMVAGELCVTGYPPEDLVLKPEFLTRCREVVEALAAETSDGGPAMILGAPWWDDAAPGEVYNAALLLDEGQVQGGAL